MLEDIRDEKTPLQQRLEDLGRWLAVLVLGVCTVVFVAGLFRGIPALSMLLTAVSLAVAAVPEGLPAILTIALAVGVQRMARRHAVVRELPAVETLGSTSVVCTDKTGTLTATRWWCAAPGPPGATRRSSRASVTPRRAAWSSGPVTAVAARSAGC